VAKFKFGDGLVDIFGCFCYVMCLRVSASRLPFTGFTCSFCSQIVKDHDFRKRVFREHKADEKRGTRSIESGRKIDFFSTRELAFHRRKLGQKIREERALHWTIRARVAELKISTRGLRLGVEENFNRKDVLSFCNNILAVNRTNAFGGKPALWDFLRDVANNLNCKKQEHCFSKNTKSFCQAIKVYGGCCMYDLFSLNFEALSFSLVKRHNKRGVRFIAGEYAAIFQCVANIYVEEKATHGINGSIPVILAKDETKVKDRIIWESHNDVLAGFCGPKEGHTYVSYFTVRISQGQESYKNILEAFRSHRKEIFARVIMVNLLHDLLLRPVLAISCTCSCFDSCWV
jgi:hypothetical protein